jgi:hypothetical protein
MFSCYPPSLRACVLFNWVNDLTGQIICCEVGQADECNTMFACHRLHSARFPYRPKRRSRSELPTTVTDERAIAAAAKMGAWVCKNGIRGERIAVGIRITL